MLIVNGEIMSKKETAKKRIIDGMFEMLQTKSYQEITVKDVSKHVGVSRMTFYRNFHTKEDVIVGQFQETFTTFINRLLAQKISNFNGLVTTFFTIIKENKPMMDAIVDNDLSYLLLKVLKKYITNLVDDDILELRANSSKMLIAMISGGLTEVLLTWTEDGMEEPVEELVIFASKYLNFKVN